MKYKQFIIATGLGIATLFPTKAQGTYNSVKSEITFEAGKNIQAKNKTSKFILRTSDNALVGLIVIKDFIFPNSLMQEHFNENYLESDTYPDASFSGKLIDFDAEKIKEEYLSYKAEGKMTIHGVEKNVVLPVSISKIGEKYKLKSAFQVQLKDYKIKIPKLMFVKITDAANVNISTDLE